MSNEIEVAVDRIFNSREFRDRIRTELIAAEQRGAAAAQRTLDTARKALYLISIVDQGCGGNLTFQEMAESAMRQAASALSEMDVSATLQPSRATPLERMKSAHKTMVQSAQDVIDAYAEPEQGGGVLADNMEDMAAALMMPQHRSDLTDDAATLLRIATTRLRDAAHRARELLIGWEREIHFVDDGTPTKLGEVFIGVRDFLRELAEEK